MHKKVVNQPIIIRFERPDKYSPAFPENDIPLPLRRMLAEANSQFKYLTWSSL
jgi:hypothetical protein